MEHNCYDEMDYKIETFTTYRPDQEQVDSGTDHDEQGQMAVCNKCGEDMPEIEL